MKLTDSLQMVKGVGPKNAAYLSSMGLNTVCDLVDYWPRRYDDYSQIGTVASLRPGPVTLKGRFGGIKSRYARRGLHITEALLTDKTGSVRVTWFNQPYRAAALKPDVDYMVSGEFVFRSGRLHVSNPRVEEAKGEATNGKILPIYKESKNITSVYLRKLTASIAPVFEVLPETLPDWLISSQGLMGYADAIKTFHLPSDALQLELAKERIGFEEVFHMQLAGVLARRDLLRDAAPIIQFEQKLAVEFVDNLAFDLTDDQRRSVWQIYKDMAKATPMNRLIEGDVGSGKTAVAAMAAMMAVHAGYQVLFMAPTEILARQHADSMTELLSHTPFARQIGLLVGGLSAKAKQLMHEKIRSGECKIAIGTNALIQDKVASKNVGLVIVDEQHRFGVEQRAKLKSKTGLTPHVLCMTATPIPRTLALTLYGELSVTQLKSMPKGRSPIHTEAVLSGARTSVYAKIDKAISSGRQAFIVCPVIQENDTEMVSVIERHKDLSKGYFKHRRVGLLHGDMKPAEKDDIMQRFKAAEIDLLISTTVIEVGVDVPNATVMVVENAERFGLAQIHQLRGRVGRGEHEGYCYLIPSEGAGITKRLRVLETVKDGFRLSEIDLEMRGPGSIYGVRQSGALDLRIAELTDHKTIDRARHAAEEFIKKDENLLQYPTIAARVNHFRSINRLN